MWKRLSSLSDTLSELLEKLPILSNIACRAHQGLLDDMLGLYKGTKHLGGHSCDCRSTFVVGTGACKRCRGADTLQFTGSPSSRSSPSGPSGPSSKAISYAPHKQGNVSSLATTVGMQFIQNQKLQRFGAEQSSLGRTREDQFEHDIVGEQDVGWICNDALALFIRFLASITLEGDRASFVGITQAEKLLQFLHLAIRQCIHGIDNDGLDTMPGAVAQHIIDDRDNVSKAFSRTCAGGEDITRASAGAVDGLGLICVQSQRPTFAIVFGFIFAENSRAFTMKNASRYKPFDRLSASK